MGDVRIVQKAEIGLLPKPLVGIAPMPERKLTLLPDCGAALARARVGKFKEG